MCVDLGDHWGTVVLLEEVFNDNESVVIEVGYIVLLIALWPMFCLRDGVPWRRFWKPGFGVTKSQGHMIAICQSIYFSE